jgi:hypothetical protein
MRLGRVMWLLMVGTCSLVSLGALSGCGDSGQDQCFDGLSIVTDSTEGDIHAKALDFCKSRGYDREVAYNAQGGRIVSICCRADGLVN